MVKNVITKKSTRKTLVSAVASLAATSGWCARKACAAKGRTTSSTTAKSTTSDETMTATTGRARIAAAVAIAADTPQIETPEASGAAHSRVRRKMRRAIRYTSAQ